MSRLRILAIEEGFVLQDAESKLYFVWRQRTEDEARLTAETLMDAWVRDSLERTTDLHVNFVDRIDRTLFHKPKFIGPVEQLIGQRADENNGKLAVWKNVPRTTEMTGRLYELGCRITFDRSGTMTVILRIN